MRKTDTSQHLFRPILPNFENRIEIIDDDFGGWSMLPVRKTYYEDQKGERRQECDRAVDPIWYTAMMRRQRLRERDLVAKRQMQERMSF